MSSCSRRRVSPHPEPNLHTGIVIAVVDIALIVHAAKTGRFMPWGFIILFLPGIGALAYVVVELLPEWFGSNKVRRARGRIAGAINPTGRYRQLHDELEIVDTIANRSALAEECLTLGKYDEALAQYDAILAKPLGEEPGFMLGKARAEYGLGDAGAAIATLEELKRRWPDYQSADGHLLYAMALEKAGRNDEALANYAAVGQYFPGAEPRVRQAQLLQSLGRDGEARALAEEVVRTLKPRSRACAQDAAAMAGERAEARAPAARAPPFAARREARRNVPPWSHGCGAMAQHPASLRPTGLTKCGASATRYAGARSSVVFRSRRDGFARVSRLSRLESVTGLRSGNSATRRSLPPIAST